MAPVAHVLTYGDLMLDVLVTGSCRRMSPEAVRAPVMLMSDVVIAAGGAANVAVNVASMGGRSTLIGAIGADATGALLSQCLQASGVATELLTREGIHTTTKVRMVEAQRQLMRLDVEEIAPLAAEAEDGMLAYLLEHLPKAHAVMISDYGKGGVTPTVAAKLIMAAAVHGIPVIVDSKTPAAKHFIGAGVIKPNLAEIAAAMACKEPETDDDAAACAQALMRQVGATFVVLTRGPRGLCLVGATGALHFAGHAVKEVDVTGAGDAVAAGLALALAGGESIVEAARFANGAGAAAVSKMGTAALTFDEIHFFYDCDVRGHHRAGQGMAGERASNRLH